jgi:hypothetical protein
VRGGGAASVAVDVGEVGEHRRLAVEGEDEVQDAGPIVEQGREADETVLVGGPREDEPAVRLRDRVERDAEAPVSLLPRAANRLKEEVRCGRPSTQVPASCP